MPPAPSSSWAGALGTGWVCSPAGTRGGFVGLRGALWMWGGRCQVRRVVRGE